MCRDNCLAFEGIVIVLALYKLKDIPYEHLLQLRMQVHLWLLNKDQM